MNEAMKRYALVTGARDADEVRAYLPDNYTVAGTVENWNGVGIGRRGAVVIEGRDVAGWTLDKYVIPRLQSGLIQAEEIDLSHPVMKLIPVRPDDTGTPDFDITRNGELDVVHIEATTDAGTEFVDAFNLSDVEFQVVDSGRIILPASAFDAFVEAAKGAGLTVGEPVVQ